jgi:hypothetical protein
MANIIYYQEKTHRKRVYYTGTDVLKHGHALCYDRDNITAVSRADGSTALGAADESYARAIFVEQPAAGNLANFAGIVAESSETLEAGPRWIDIVEPTNSLFNVFTEENCTSGVTLLTVKPGSYVLGGAGEGLVVGIARQTVNRSTTNGLVQAQMLGLPDPINVPYGPALPSGTNNSFSPVIWETCPWTEMVRNPGLGYTYFDDFASAQVMASATAQGPHLSYQDTGVTIAPLETSDEVGGVLEIANNDADNDEGHFGLGSSALFNLMKIAATGSKPCWFEARLKKASVADNSLALFVGVGQEGFIAADALADDTGVPADKDFVGWKVLHADGDALVGSYKKEGQTVQNVSGASAAIAADTYFNAGFFFNGSAVSWVFNGVSLGSVANVAAATFPDGEEMTPILLSKVGAAVEVACQMDWWRFAQIR